MNYGYPYQYQSAQPSNGITWVQGVEGAKAYQLAPNSNALLMDSENEGVFYIKVSDSIGMCSLRIFKYEEMTNQQPQSQVDMSEYVKKSDLEKLVNEMLGGKSDEQSVSTAKSTIKF